MSVFNQTAPLSLNIETHGLLILGHDRNLVIRCSCNPSPYTADKKRNCNVASTTPIPNQLSGSNSHLYSYQSRYVPLALVAHFLVRHKMNQAIFSSPEDASTYLANYIIAKINDFGPTPSKPFVLGLPTGSSPEGIYARLVKAYKNGKLSFANVVTFNMDEYLGLRPSHPQLYHYFMYDKLFNHVDIPKENINILNGLASNTEKECAAYEAKIKHYGRIHLFLGGLGPEGHLAFNEAGSSRNSVTRVVDLVDSTIQANCRFFDNDPAKVPKKALSVGISTILDNSDEVAIIVLGANKRFALDKTLHGPASDPRFPSSYLRDHHNVLVVCDHAAAGLSAKL